ncbi:MAG: hypothetical protein ACI9FD_004157, partial [Gammaproteobacteria bacterium]
KRAKWADSIISIESIPLPLMRRISGINFSKKIRSSSDNLSSSSK